MKQPITLTDDQTRLLNWYQHKLETGLWTFSEYHYALYTIYQPDLVEDTY